MKATFYIVLFFSALMLLGSCHEEVVNGDDDLFHTWEVTEFISLESVAYPKNEDTPILLTFKRDGTYALKLDMNSCSGTYEKGEGYSIGILPPGCTKICCDSQFSVKLTEMLSKVTSFQMDDNTLQLHVPGWGYIEMERKE